MITDLLPECYMAKEEIRELRRILRYRNLIVSEAVKMKNKISGLGILSAFLNKPNQKQ